MTPLIPFTLSRPLSLPAYKHNADITAPSPEWIKEAIANVKQHRIIEKPKAQDPELFDIAWSKSNRSGNELMEMMLHVSGTREAWAQFATAFVIDYGLGKIVDLIFSKMSFKEKWQKAKAAIGHLAKTTPNNLLSRFEKELAPQGPGTLECEVIIDHYRVNTRLDYENGDDLKVKIFFFSLMHNKVAEYLVSLPSTTRAYINVIIQQNDEVLVCTSENDGGNPVEKILYPFEGI